MVGNDGQTQPRWYWLYFALAAFDLLTVSFSLYLNHQLTETYSQSIEVNEQWARRLGDYSELRDHASKVNAPGNDVFDSQDVDKETARLQQALGEFDQKLNSAKQELSRNTWAEKVGELLLDFANIRRSMDEMVAESELIFNFLREGQPREAGGRMATMDRKYASLNQSFSKLEGHVRDLQRQRFSSQRELAEKLRRAEYGIVAAIILMVLGVTWYGSRVMREMTAATRVRESLLIEVRRARDELDHRVDERTAELRLTTENLNAEIAERKRAEQALQQLNDDLENRVRRRTAALVMANKELEAFSYSVSHDLRSPLRGIDGWSAALLEDYSEKLDETGKSYLNRVRAEAMRMSDLIDSMLELSRVMRADLRREQVDLSRMANDLVSALRQREPQRTVDVVIQPAMVARGDAHLLRQVLQNLLDNAWKFTGKRKDARILFSAARDNDQTVYHVSDNGAGFDMAYAGKLFSAFQRLHKTVEFPGTGVGLATVQRIIHRHGGKIWVDSKVDEGTTFHFTIEESA